MFTSLYPRSRLQGQMLALMFLLFGMVSQGALAKERGEALFELCTSCHGEQGEGQTAIQAPAIAGLPLWYLERQLMNFMEGVRGLHPHDLAGMRMRPMARTLKVGGDYTDVTLVSKYVEQLPVPKTAKTVKLASETRGEQQYKVCVACHGVDGKGNQLLNAPPLVGQSDWYMLSQLKNFQNGMRGADPAKDPNGAAMAAISMTLDQQAMRDVIVYISTLK
jgi:cytochrome c553